jgi:hypothetical protein
VSKLPYEEYVKLDLTARHWHGVSEHAMDQARCVVHARTMRAKLLGAGDFATARWYLHMIPVYKARVLELAVRTETVMRCIYNERSRNASTAG